MCAKSEASSIQRQLKVPGSRRCVRPRMGALPPPMVLSFQEARETQLPGHASACRGVRQPGAVGELGRQDGSVGKGTCTEPGNLSARALGGRRDPAPSECQSPHHVCPGVQMKGEGENMNRLIISVQKIDN